MRHRAPSVRPAVRVALLVGALAWPTLLSAQSQTSAAIRGTVLRPEGAPLAEVTVRVRHRDTGAERLAVTDERGRFLVLLLPPGGPYEVVATHLGFADGREGGIQLQVGETHDVRLVLQARAIEVEGVDVSVERAEIFNPGQVGPATLLNEALVASVPLLSRDVMELAVLSPLVRTTEQGGFSVGGQNDRYNAILVDGLVNQDPFGLTAGGVPGGQAGAKLLPLDAVAQYEILVAPYDARLSGFAGGVMNAITRSGTNEWIFRGAAVGRHEALMGDLTLPTGPAEASGVKRGLLAVSGGGPLIRDRAHVFVAAEVERRSRPPSGYNVGRDAAELVGITPESMATFQDRFRGAFGLEPGVAEAYPLDQEVVNAFGRVDWQLAPRHRLTVRDIFARATNDESPNRSAFEPYELSSNAVYRTSTTNTLAAQLFTDLGNQGGHEVDLTIQRTTDRTDPASPYPQVEATLLSPEGSLAANRPLRVGAQFYAQQNDLEQTRVRLSNAVTLGRGASTYTFGASVGWVGIRHAYLPGARGAYTFPTWADLLNNAPLWYQRSVLEDGVEPEVDFGALEAGAFVQNQLAFENGLTVRYGIRADVPVVLGGPGENPAVLQAFDRSTAKMPRPRILLSPRLGFNWQSGGRLRTQLRGGAGLFTGQLPYVWLSNAFHNDGLRSVTRVCYGRWTTDPAEGNTAPPFDPGNPDPTCLKGAPTEVRTVTLFDEDFTYPQYVKLSASVDREITESLTASVGVLFSHSVNQVVVRELNIRQVTDLESLGPLRGFGATRPHYGDTVDAGFVPVRPVEGLDQVLLATNGGGDRSYSVSAELQGRLLDRVGFQAGYAYARSYDRMSLASVDLVSNYGLTPTHGDPNDPPLTPSNFDRPHKVVLALHGNFIPGLDDTMVSLLYTGESGLPFSYVYRGDLNGDGYPGLGSAFDRNNDLMYVPLEPTEVPGGIGMLTRLAAALETDACLQAFAGHILLRNHCRAPWQNRLDVRVSHRLGVGGADVRLEVDAINVLNLMHGDWGLVQTIPPVTALLEPLGRNSQGNGELFMDWGGGVLPFRGEDGTLLTPQPWSVVSPDSQWQIQLGARVTFGGRR